MERNNLTSFARIAASLRARDEFPGAARKVFVAVDAAHVVPSEREAMLQPAWPGVAFAVDLKWRRRVADESRRRRGLDIPWRRRRAWTPTPSDAPVDDPRRRRPQRRPAGRSASPRPRAPDRRPRNGTLLENAIVDGYICSRATWFVGWPGSTFTNQITLARSISNKTSFFYNNRGVFPRTDDGRRVRERFSYDNRGAQRLADLRDRARARTAAVSANEAPRAPATAELPQGSGPGPGAVRADRLARDRARARARAAAARAAEPPRAPNLGDRVERPRLAPSQGVRRNLPRPEPGFVGPGDARKNKP